MAAKSIILICAQVLLVNIALSQNIIGRPGIAPGLAGPYGLAYDGLPGPYGPNGPFSPAGPYNPAGPYSPSCGCGTPASSGGGFQVTSYSPIAPTGLTIKSENAIEGILSVGGEVPFLGSVALEGVLPTAGAGTINYGCGNGAIGISSEGPITTGIVGPGPVGPGYGPYGPAGLGPAGLVGPYNGLGYNGLGCGAI